MFSHIPTDPASIFVYILLVAAIVGIARAGRSRKAREDRAPDA